MFSEGIKYFPKISYSSLEIVGVSTSVLRACVLDSRNLQKTNKQKEHVVLLVYMQNFPFYFNISQCFKACFFLLFLLVLRQNICLIINILPIYIHLFLLSSHSVMANSLRPHGMKHTWLPCPLPTPRKTCSNSCP